MKEDILESHVSSATLNGNSASNGNASAATTAIMDSDRPVLTVEGDVARILPVSSCRRPNILQKDHVIGRARRWAALDAEA